MGILVNGSWTDDESAAQVTGKDGRFQRAESKLRNWVTPDGAPGPSGEGGFPAEAGRYHLYVAINCPWAHRTMIFRKLKKLEDVISMSITSPLRKSGQGWEFGGAREGYADTLLGKSLLHEVYSQGHPGYTGRVTVPVLWDKEREVIVNNESSEIIRMFNGAFNAFTGDNYDFYPDDSRAAIDEWNGLIYETINNGVYRTGFARSQEAYEEAFDALFDTLDKLDAHLETNRYISGGRISEADWRLFPTLVRFDVAYVGAFKCNKRRIADYPNLWNFTRALYQMPGIAGTVHLDHIKDHYYMSHPQINPARIVPRGPELDFTAPHDREKKFGENNDRNHAA